MYMEDKYDDSVRKKAKRIKTSSWDRRRPRDRDSELLMKRSETSSLSKTRARMCVTEMESDLLDYTL